MLKLKLDAEGRVVTHKEGDKILPVFVHDDGSEKPFDADATVATISRLNAEAKTHREGKEAAESKLKLYDGITDPAAALKALGIVKNLDDKKLVDANQVEQIKAEAIKAVEQQWTPWKTKAEQLEQQLYNERIGGAFARSPLIVGDKRKLALPADLVQARFGSQFKIEDGRTVAYDHHGNKIYSKVRPGELADFDEALEQIVDMYPNKSSILLGSGSSGQGSQNNNQGAGGKKTMTRADFERLDPITRGAEIKAGTVIT